MAATASIFFDPHNHTYWHKDRQIPSVTQILKPLYGDLRFVAEDLLQYKSELGTAVHKAVELHILGELDVKSLVSPVLEYFQQYLKFVIDTGFRPLESEVRVHSGLGYAGTLDIVGMLNGRKAIIDLKTCAVISPAVALQLSAYQAAYNEQRAGQDRASARYALRLLPERYTLHPFKPSADASDFAGFIGFLKAYQWCQANNKQIQEMTSHV